MSAIQILDPKELVSLPKAAEMLGMTHVTLWRHVRDGNVKADVFSGHSQFFFQSHIKALKAALNRERSWRNPRPAPAPVIHCAKCGATLAKGQRRCPVCDSPNLDDL